MSSRVVVVGDGATGKTSLISSFGRGEELPSGSIEVISLVKSGKASIQHVLELVDTQDDEVSHSRSRTTQYASANLFIVLFSVISPYSYENVQSKWYPELNRISPDTPILLVGTKTDLRDDEGIIKRLAGKHLAPITPKLGNKMRKTISAVAYLECSIENESSMQQILDFASFYLCNTKKSHSVANGLAGVASSGRGTCTTM
eukprot:TRINITY_DN7101_c0_g1_i1.p1 TRINITY_DN7101_c0_g1~~TRINITY_DN7101_c0_g1_i1.p1  ORF type:complete len:202 (+),score=32.81 TRINITY_DN7101_c0_g1_i1:120-725(+)